jgi:3-oxoisoapionate decarboxylase
MIGLGSYAFFWRQSDRVERPLSLIEVLERTRELGVGLFQICDYAPLAQMSEPQLADAARAARDLDLQIEIGIKDIRPDALARLVRLAEVFGARTVRSMIFTPGARPDVASAEESLRRCLPDFDAAGVTLALETYEQLPSTELVDLVRRIDHDRLGICLDPGNMVAGLELPREVVQRCAEWTRNVHAKDFAFARQDGWVGFTYSGAPMGEGLLDYPHLLATVQPERRGINEIVEHWLPWQGSPQATVDAEIAWTDTALDYLRRSR